MAEKEPASPPTKEAPLEDLSRPTSKTTRLIYFDLETQKSAAEVGGWSNCHLMRVSVAVIFDSLENRFMAFTEEEIEDLITHLGKGDLVVGFNVKRFDYAVLGAYTHQDLSALATFDILEDLYQRLGFRLSLDHMAKETLGAQKTADGLQALEWFKQGDMQKLTDYCRHDVAITKDLFEYGLEKGHLIYRTKKEDRRVKLRVDWDLENLLQR